ncbi:MAG: hypothetical protein IJU47_02200, partial [Verrucomicrobia bacterium]|nr:hypothetical protein [Verrucomicrobiota bacterium]
MMIFGLSHNMFRIIKLYCNIVRDAQPSGHSCGIFNRSPGTSEKAERQPRTERRQRHDKKKRDLSASPVKSIQ